MRLLIRIVVVSLALLVSAPSADAAWSTPAVLGNISPVSPNINGGSLTVNTSTACGGGACDFFVAAVTSFAAVITWSDSVGGNSNTWVLCTAQQSGGGTRIQLAYANAGTGTFYTGSSHQFTVSCTACYAGAAVLGFTGSYTAGDPGGTCTGNQTSGTTLKPGAITPGNNDSLLVTGLSSGASAPADMTIDSPFTKSETVTYSAGGAIGGAIGYAIQVGSPTSADPTWSSSTSTVGLAALMREFRPAATAAATGKFKAILGVGK